MMKVIKNCIGTFKILVGKIWKPINEHYQIRKIVEVSHELKKKSCKLYLIQRIYNIILDLYSSANKLILNIFMIKKLSVTNK